jgi:hypothetical protein
MKKQSEEKHEIMGIDRAAIARIDDIVSEYSLPMLTGQKGFERDLMIAEGIKALELAITDDMVMKIKSLEGNTLGYLTDRDKAPKPPKIAKPKYLPAEIKKVWIAAALMGLRMSGNQVNVIDSRLYVPLAGMIHLVKNYPGLADLIPQLNLKEMDTTTGKAIVNFQASWTLQGRPDSLAGEIPIRCDEYSSVDQVLGKARRKMLARIYEYLTGSAHIPDGEIGEEEPRAAIPQVLPPKKLTEGQGKVSFKRHPAPPVDVTPEAPPQEPDATEPEPAPEEPAQPEEPTGPPQPPADLLPLLIPFVRGPFIKKTYWDCAQSKEGMQYLDFVKEKKPDQVELIDRIIKAWEEYGG